MLFEKTVSWFQEKRISRIELNAASTNDVSHSFWRKRGFQDFMIRMSKEM
ncbi:MAG: GNAT family N-acetyltransferase [Proteobacteria bacterium]|nr:GNAT family N-acetyltransferase [Pseudomonadota bacterium]